MSKSTSNNTETSGNIFQRILKSRIVKHLFFIAIFLLLVLGAILFWLSMYTNHGQKLEMPDYVSTHLDDASDDAEDKSFEIIVNDSIHIVGEPGGMIRSQNPLAGARRIQKNIDHQSGHKIPIDSQ